MMVETCSLNENGESYGIPCVKSLCFHWDFKKKHCKLNALVVK